MLPADFTKSLLENTSDAFLSVDSDWRVTYVNSHAPQLLRILPEQMLGGVLWDLFPEAVNSTFYKQYHRIMKEGGFVEFEEYYPPMDIWFEVRALRFNTGLGVFFRDITQRKKTHRQQELYALLDRHMQEIIVIMDFGGSILEINQAGVASYGYTKEELLKLTVFDLRTPQEHEAARYQFARVQQQGDICFETIHRRKDGTVFPVKVSSVTADLGGQQVVLSIISDITERKRAESAMRQYSRQLEMLLRERIEKQRQADDRFQKMFHANPAIMNINCIKTGQYIDINESFTAVMGYSFYEVIGKRPSEIGIWANPADAAMVWALIKEKKPIDNLEISFRAKSGEIRVGLVSAVYIAIDGQEYVLSVTMDITELRRYEREIFRLDRLNLVGQIAASIGHEVRNPMTTVRGYLQMLGSKQTFAEYKVQFNLMIEELDRANQIITEFLSLAKNRANDRRLLNINELVLTVFPLVEADVMAAGRRIRTALHECPPVIVDPKEINQLLLNLVRNAIEATEKDGVIVIETLSRDESVVLAVENNGPPIPQCYLDTLGTPFFTTKEKGTGLGLPVCYSIADRNNAQIMVSSLPERTRFEVVFPVP